MPNPVWDDTRWLFDYLKAVLAQLGYPVYLTSGLRSTSKQAILYKQFLAGRSKYPVAPPGTSKHEIGLAFDMGGSVEALQVAGALAPFFGLRWGGTFSTPDPVHFERTE